MAGNLSADFVVIDSGIIGSLAGRKLAQAGASVLILEAGPRVTRNEIVARFRNSPRRSDWIGGKLDGWAQANESHGREPNLATAARQPDPSRLQWARSRLRSSVAQLGQSAPDRSPRSSTTCARVAPALRRR